jgi:hypothetical protein
MENVTHPGDAPVLAAVKGAARRSAVPYGHP